MKSNVKMNPNVTLTQMINSCGEVFQDSDSMGRVAVDVSKFTKTQVRNVAKSFGGTFFEDDEAWHLVLNMKTMNAHRGAN